MNRFQASFVLRNVRQAVGDFDSLDARLDAMGGGGGAADSFETVAKNLSAANATLGYSSGDLVTVTYAGGVVKTLAYSGGNLVTVTLSGATPSGIDLVKTLTYTGDELTGVSYS